MSTDVVSHYQNEWITILMLLVLTVRFWHKYCQNWAEFVSSEPAIMRNSAKKPSLTLQVDLTVKNKTLSLFAGRRFDSSAAGGDWREGSHSAPASRERRGGPNPDARQHREHMRRLQADLLTHKRTWIFSRTAKNSQPRRANTWILNF